VPEVIRALPSPAESKKLWDSPSGTLIINLIAMIVIAFYAEHGADVRQRSSDESMKELTELVQKIVELLQTHTEKAPPPLRGCLKSVMAGRNGSA
jgi:hypothetical protein